MEWLIFGAGGLVGSYLAKLLKNKKETIGLISKNAPNVDYNINAENREEVERIIKKEKPQFIINSIKSSMSTDNAEKNKNITWRTNVLIPESLAKLSKKYKCKLIHISSDWVYEGRDKEVYTEQSLTYPKNFYAYSKSIAEERVIAYSKDYVILRPEGIFGIDRKETNFFSRIKTNMEKGKVTMAVNNQYAQPIYAKTLAEIIYFACKKNVNGIFNAVGKDYISRYELAMLFCDEFGWCKELIKPISCLKRTIRIPQYLRVNMKKTESKIMPIPNIKKQIKELKEEICNDKQN